MNAPEAWDDGDSVFADFVRTVSSEEEDFIVLIKSYFDESYDRDLLCVAGYSFAAPKAREFDKEWGEMLGDYKLPYFRMSACNAGKDPFDKLSEAECIAVASDAIKLIGKYAHIGYAVTVNKKDFSKIITPKGFVSTPYEFCAFFCLVAARDETREAFKSIKISYVFEFGFQDQGLANQMMNRIFREPGMREWYAYKSHNFFDKTECRPT